MILALATPHSLEIYASVYATIWGLATALYPQYLQHPHTVGLLAYVGGRGELLGLFPALVGLCGLLALRTGNRKLRASAAFWLFLFWWLLAGWFLTREPVVISAVIAYGLSALAEAWVYVRVSQNFDDLVRDVRAASTRRHDRDDPRAR